MSASKILSLHHLSVDYGGTKVLRDISFTLARGETLALVGLSGCGKTTALRAMLGLLPRRASVAGLLRINGEDCMLGDSAALRRRLGHQIGFVPQNPFDACGPLRTIRAHIAEAWRAHDLRPDPARITALCTALGLDPQMLDRYPHEWSGGMLQRANIAAAVALEPDVIVADEPTSAVDADLAEDIMTCLQQAAAGVIIVSHDLGLMARRADQILLLDKGTIIARASKAQLAADDIPAPLHAFQQMEKIIRPAAAIGQPILQVKDLSLARGGRAVVSDLSLRLCTGQVLGIAGPSGVGKSSLLAALAGDLAPSKGVILRDGVVRPPARAEVISLFQDAGSSLNPRWPLDRIIAEPLTVKPKRPQNPAVAEALQQFGLDHLDRRTRPGSLSTGQSQRLTLARASLAAARIVLADEPTSALDPRQKAAALAGLARLATKGAAIVLVSHDRALLQDFCHDVIILTPPRS